VQRKRKLNPEREKVIDEEVKKFLSARFIIKVQDLFYVWFE